MKRKKDEAIIDELRNQFDLDTPQSRLTLAEQIVAMRKIAGMTQPNYANFLKVAERTLMDVEAERGNPTLATLNKIGKPFGLEIGFVKINKK